MIVKTTNGVTIKVRHKFLAEHSNPQRHQFNFGYRVTISNERHNSIQLLRRCWYIVDLTGQTKVVKGEGVIGEQPIIEPNTQFEYSSWSPLTTRFGAMSGHYTMYDVNLKEEFQVEIPKFMLEFPPALN